MNCNSFSSPYVLLAEYRFRTLNEAYETAMTAAKHFPDPDRVYYGIHELMINAVEHGNLEIGGSAKSSLIASGSWLQEIDRRLCSEQWSQRIAIAQISANLARIRIRIVDEGAGFDWQPYMVPHPPVSRAFNGRGISSARALSFDALEYVAPGNCVIGSVSLSA